jgi:hypothetical protein
MRGLAPEEGVRTAGLAAIAAIRQQRWYRYDGLSEFDCPVIADGRGGAGESLCSGARTTTIAPIFTRLVMRMQPDDTALPIFSG